MNVQEFSANLPLKMRRMTMQRWCKTFWITRTFLFFGQKISGWFDCTVIFNCILVRKRERFSSRSLEHIFHSIGEDGELTLKPYSRFPRKIAATVLPIFHLILIWGKLIDLENILSPFYLFFMIVHVFCLSTSWPSVHPSNLFFLYHLQPQWCCSKSAHVVLFTVWIAYGWRWFERNRICERSKLCPSAACKSCATLGSMHFGRAMWHGKSLAKNRRPSKV